MRRGVVFAACVAAVLLSSASAGQAGRDASSAALPVVPFPAAGNVTVARLTITSSKGSTGAPRLALASRRGIPAGAFVIAEIGRRAVSGRFPATVVIVNPSAPTSSAPASRPVRFVTLRLPAGFSLAGPPQIAKNVLYANPTPAFALVSGGSGSLLGGEAPPKIAIARVVRDAQLLALDRSVPLADMSLFELPYVTVQLPRVTTTSLPVTIGLIKLGQVNAVELRFPSGMRVAKVTGPAGTDGLLFGNAVQLVASRGFFQEGLPYSFTLELSRAPKQGEFVTVRASEHYFESSLPFTERFALS